ncbi:MAG TPA: DUF362 domain-containing protein [Candidatus Aminicenantes bacterium]|nr:DUF362 domain-containing protein [Candidatus Aminicenantes bacterium]
MKKHRVPFRLAAVAALFALLLPALGAALPAADAQAAKTRVVLARNPKAIDGRDQCNAAEAARLFDRALSTLTDTASAAEAWKTLGVVPGDTVAIKVNCNNWTISLSPKPELVAALCRSLQAVVPAARIIVYDNDAGALRAAGIVENRLAGARVMSTAGGGFDEGQRLANLLVRDATKVINLASMKTVDEKDLIVSLLLKNHIGSLVPADMPKCHGDHDFLAGVCARPAIRGRTVLNMVSGLRASYRRGVPWYWGGIVLGRDPLAVETAAIGVINEKRKVAGLGALPLPRYLAIAAEKYKLGTCDPARIETVKLEL